MRRSRPVRVPPREQPDGPSPQFLNSVQRSLPRAMNEKIASVIELIRASDLEGAKKEVEALAQTAKSERDRGGLMALNGILVSISRGKDRMLQTWESGKVARAANAIRKSQMADDWDRGYADILTSYSKIAQRKQ